MNGLRIAIVVEYKQDYGGAWPLMERQTSILDTNQGSLSEILDFTGNEIVNELYSRKVLNKRQREFICARSCDQEKAQTLLDILYRSSMSDYSKMIHCLLVTNQNNVAKILLDGGGMFTCLCIRLIIIIKLESHQFKNTPEQIFIINDDYHG